MAGMSCAARTRIVAMARGTGRMIAAQESGFCRERLVHSAHAAHRSAGKRGRYAGALAMNLGALLESPPDRYATEIGAPIRVARIGSWESVPDLERAWSA